MKIEKKIHYSNVNLLDPVYQEKTRVALRFTDDGEAVRIAKKSTERYLGPSRGGLVRYRQTSNGSFSAVSNPIFAS